MDAKEVKTHIAQLEKATKDKLPSSHIIDILTSLKNGIVATEALLRETRVGMTVNKLRNGQDKAVTELAKEIVGKWKTDVQKRKPAGTAQTRKAATTGPTQARKATASPRASSTPLSPQKSKKLESKNLPPGKRNKVVDCVVYKVTGNTTRDSCVGLLYDALCIDCDKSSDHILEVAKSVEKAVLSNHKDKIEIPYKRRMQALYVNLKDNKNSIFRSNVVTGVITPDQVATMNTSEMANPERKAVDQKLQEENMLKSMAAKQQKSYSDQLTCGKCKQKKVAYTQAQTRSADEPMTTFCTCEHCGNMWKFS